MTKKQEDLLNAFLAGLALEDEAIYRDIAMYLSELGYKPNKQGTRITFLHPKHTKQIAKMGMSKGKAPHVKPPWPVFKLRFSACKEYSQRFADAISAVVAGYPNSYARCIDGDCGYCAGEPATHVYTCTGPDGQVKTCCGAVALHIPDITARDLDEIKRLLREEHSYLMKYQAGIEVAYDH